MDVSKRFCNGERKFLLEIEKGCKASFLCKHILLGDLLGSQYLLEILQISLTFKNSEKKW